jgi:sugar lactone lactonase YvrE
MFVVDGRGGRVVWLSAVGAFKGYVEPKGLPAPASSIAKSMVIDKKDHLYLLDVFSARVIVLKPNGEYLKQIEFPKEHGFGAYGFPHQPGHG